MKRFLTALAISAFLIVGAGVYAGDYTWTGGTSPAWEVGGNWAGAGFPGSGVPSRVIDRAVIANATNNPVLFTGASGDANFQSRMIQELRLDATGLGAGVSLTVNGDRLQVRHIEMVSGAAAAETATLTVTGVTGASFKTDDLVADASAAGTTPVTLDIDVDTRVSGQTVIKGEVECDAAPGVVMDLGYVTMEDGSVLTKLNTGVCESS